MIRTLRLLAQRSFPCLPLQPFMHKISSGLMKIPHFAATNSAIEAVALSKVQLFFFFFFPFQPQSGKAWNICYLASSDKSPCNLSAFAIMNCEFYQEIAYVSNLKFHCWDKDRCLSVILKVSGALLVLPKLVIDDYWCWELIAYQMTGHL